MHDQLGPSVQLNDGHRFPVVGLGVWQAKGKELERAITAAWEAGYRHIDCATLYGNEAEVADTLRKLGLEATQNVTVTTKVWNDDVRQGDTLKAVHRSLRRMKREQLDVVLIHWPADGYLLAWEVLEEAKAQGLIRSIGVSNFMAEHLNNIVALGGTIPTLNQFEHHPYLTQLAARSRSLSHNIFPIAHTPLMQGNFMNEGIFQRLADNYNITAAQVVLRWNLQHGIGVIPKSVNPQRIAENINLFHFELTTDDMQQIDRLDRDRRFSGNPYQVDF